MGTPLRVESSVEVKRNSQKKDYQQQGCEGGAVFVELGDITDLDRFCLGCFHLDGVGAGYLLFAPTGVPLFKIDGIGASDKRRMGRIGRMFQCAAPVLYTDAVVEIDAVALGVGGGVVSG